jgi:hypothetical protein
MVVWRKSLPGWPLSYPQGLTGAGLVMIDERLLD